MQKDRREPAADQPSAFGRAQPAASQPADDVAGVKRSSVWGVASSSSVCSSAPSSRSSWAPKICWRIRPRASIYRILEREGLITLPRRPPEDEEAGRRGKRRITRDKPTAIERAHALRTDGLSLRKIAEQLQKERILPARCDVWHAASILDLLRQPVPASSQS